MSSAARLRRLDESAEIVVLDRGGHVSFANCGLPYHIGGVIKDRDSLLLNTPQSLLSSLNLTVRIRHEVSGIDRACKVLHVKELDTGRTYEERYEKLVIASGAEPVKPAIPGIHHPRILTLRSIEDMDRIKSLVDNGAKNAVVIGGGYIGIEMAENLRRRGLQIDLVEMMRQILPPLDYEMTRPIEAHMREQGVVLHLGTAASAFIDKEGRVGVELTSGVHLAADLVILSAGVRPDVELARNAGLTLGAFGGIAVDQYLLTSDSDIYAAGDAVEVKDLVTRVSSMIPLAGPANRQGRIVGDNLAGRVTTYSATQGSAVIKVFAMTGGGTGASEKALIKTGKPYRKIYLHPAGHASYYPGSLPMHMKLLFDPHSGTVLGAQIVGFDGVDKRLDVLATALRARMTVYDLESLELTYAPPYGSAKDPVNMAGFIASNCLKGDLTLWHAEEYPKGTADGVIVDVRGPQEFDTWHIPGAFNIPLGKLRAKADTLPRDKPVFVYCKVGFRSYLAYRLLKQNGLDRVAMLSGGALTFQSVHGQGAV